MTKFDFSKVAFFSALIDNAFEMEVIDRKGNPLTIDADTMKEFCENEIARNKAKSKKSGKLTAKQAENETIKTSIVDYMREVNAPLTVSQIVKAFDNEYSIPKISALVKQLKDNGTVKRFEEKRVAYFEIVDTLK